MGVYLGLVVAVDALAREVDGAREMGAAVVAVQLQRQFRQLHRALDQRPRVPLGALRLQGHV
eukprot:7803088-Pyramimonas_sp.AAC.1